MARAAVRQRAFVVAGLALVSAPAMRAHAQQPAQAVARDDARFSFYDHGPYRPGVPKPESLLGYPIGGPLDVAAKETVEWWQAELNE